MTTHNSSTLFFAGLVTGGLVGAGLVLLLTPQSGEKTRSQIKAKSLALKDEAAEGLAEAGQHAQDRVDIWQEKGQAVAEAVNQSKDTIIRAVNDSKDSVVKAVGSSK
jgi:gas vesicle protein